jgi:hypothetical protein
MAAGVMDPELQKEFDEYKKVRTGEEEGCVERVRGIAVRAWRFERRHPKGVQQPYTAPEPASRERDGQGCEGLAACSCCRSAPTMWPQEFSKMKDGEPVYKMIGPVMVLQDIAEAKSTVDRRLELIRGELSRAESRIEELQAKEEAIKDRVIALQRKASKGGK